MEVRDTNIEVRALGYSSRTRERTVISKECAESIEDALSIAQEWRDSGQIAGNDDIEIEFKAKGISNGEA